MHDVPRKKPSTRAHSWRMALVVGLLLTWAPPGMSRGSTRHVLVLSSSERPFAPQSSFADALVPELIQASPEPIDFVEMSVQDARSSALSPDGAFAERLRSALAAQRPDLVITIGGPAATFAQQFRQRLFQTIPMLFAGVDSRFVARATLSDNETTVAVQHEPALIIDEILRVLPETRKVMVVIGASRVEQFWLEEMRREFHRFDGRLQFVWTTELSFAEMMERCRTLPAHSAILFATLSLDARGEPQAGAKAFASLYSVANAPMFGLYDRDLGRGIVGGPLLSIEKLSRTTATVALRILAGELPGAIKTPVQRSDSPTFDWRELRRWNIQENRLHPSSVVRFRESSPSPRHTLLLGALLVAIPLFGVILLVGLRRRRKAQGHVTARQDVAVPLSANATVTMWRSDVAGRRAEVSEAADVAPNSDTWAASVHPDDLDRCLELYQRALARREPFQLEYRLRDGNGAERWILDSGLPKFSGQQFEGYVGSAVDVTPLGRARAELSNLSRHLIQAHERERAEIARKLHEDVGQRIMALALQLHGLKAPPRDGEIRAVVDQIGEQLEGLVGDLYRVPDAIHHKLELVGLTTACRRRCQELSAAHGVAIHFHHEQMPDSLPTDVALALFRVLEEATINAAVHSASADVWVSLRGTPTEIRLRILDQGVGFETSPGSSIEGVGLVAIRERLNLVKGGSSIQSGPGQGTCVEAWVPLAAVPPIRSS